MNKIKCKFCGKMIEEKEKQNYHICKLKDQVIEILKDFGKTKNIPKTELGNIDMNKFSKTQAYKQVCKELTELGVNTEWLFKNGFVSAGMILKIK